MKYMSVVSPSGFSQSGMGSMPPFQTSMSSTFGQIGMGSAMDSQKTSGLFGVESKTSSYTSGSNVFKTGDTFPPGGPGVHSMAQSTGITVRVDCIV